MSQHHDIADYAYDPISGFRPGSDASKIKPGGLQDRFRNMHPFLRTLLITDGTVTKYLEAYLWEPIRVETLSQAEIRLTTAVPALELKSGDAVLRRRVLLRGRQSGRVYTFAESYVRMDQLDAGIQNDLREERLGMGELLRDRRLETYREILEFGEEKADQDLSACFEIKEGAPVYFRRYRINVKGRPLIWIVEKFFEPHFSWEEKK